MNRNAFRLIGAAMVGLLIIAGCGAGTGSPPRTDDTAAARSSTTAPTAPPSPTVAPAPTPIDTTGWVPFTSSRYGFSIAHPIDWTEEPSDHDWTFENDIESWTSTATESFYNQGLADGLGVKVSAWSVAVAPGTTAESWIQAFCDATNPSPCTGVLDGVADVETGDHHPGILSQHGDTMAVFLDRQTIYVVAVWRGETDPSVRPYGGARRLLEAYISTLTLPAVPPQESPAAS